MMNDEDFRFEVIELTVCLDWNWGSFVGMVVSDGITFGRDGR